MVGLFVVECLFWINCTARNDWFFLLLTHSSLFEASAVRLFTCLTVWLLGVSSRDGAHCAIIITYIIYDLCLLISVIDSLTSNGVARWQWPLINFCSSCIWSFQVCVCVCVSETDKCLPRYSAILWSLDHEISVSQDRDWPIIILTHQLMSDASDEAIRRFNWPKLASNPLANDL